MKKNTRILISAILGTFFGAAVALAVDVEGVSTTGTGVPPRPVYIGGNNGGNVTGMRVTAAGDLTTSGGTADGAASPNGIVIAGKDTANSFVRTVTCNPAGNTITNTPNCLILGGAYGTSGSYSTKQYACVTDGDTLSTGTAASPGGIPAVAYDGANTRFVRSDASGRLIVIGGQTSGAAPIGASGFMIGGLNANTSNYTLFAADSLGNQSNSGQNYVLVKSHPAWIGVNANAWNNAAVGVNGTSNVLTTEGVRRIEAFGNTSAASTITLQVSQDNTNWYDATATTGVGGNSVAANGNFNLSFDCGARYVRLKSSAAVTITATLAGKG